jgi:hypothetical protein
VQERLGRGADVWYDRSKRCEQVCAKGPRLVVCGVERQPGCTMIGVRGVPEPLGEQGGLAEPGWCRDQGHRGSVLEHHPFGEPGSRDDLAASAWRVQLGRQQQRSSWGFSGHRRRR